MRTILNDKIVVINPAAFTLGRCVVVVALAVVGLGIASCVRGDVLVAAPIWFAASVPTMIVGAILIGCSLSKL